MVLEVVGMMVGVVVVVLIAQAVMINQLRVAQRMVKMTQTVTTQW